MNFWDMIVGNKQKKDTSSIKKVFVEDVFSTAKDRFDFEYRASCKECGTHSCYQFFSADLYVEEKAIAGCGKDHCKDRVIQCGNFRIDELKKKKRTFIYNQTPGLEDLPSDLSVNPFRHEVGFEIERRLRTIAKRTNDIIDAATIEEAANELENMRLKMTDDESNKSNLNVFVLLIHNNYDNDSHVHKVFADKNRMLKYIEEEKKGLSPEEVFYFTVRDIED